MRGLSPYYNKKKKKILRLMLANLLLMLLNMSYKSKRKPPYNML